MSIRDSALMEKIWSGFVLLIVLSALSKCVVEEGYEEVQKSNETISSFFDYVENTGSFFFWHMLIIVGILALVYFTVSAITLSVTEEGTADGDDYVSLWNTIIIYTAFVFIPCILFIAPAVAIYLVLATLPLILMLVSIQFSYSSVPQLITSGVLSLVILILLEVVSYRNFGKSIFIEDKARVSVERLERVVRYDLPLVIKQLRSDKTALETRLRPAKVVHRDILENELAELRETLKRAENHQRTSKRLFVRYESAKRVVERNRELGTIMDNSAIENLSKIEDEIKEFMKRSLAERLSRETFD